MTSTPPYRALFVAALILVSIAAPETSRADTAPGAPALPGWSALGQVLVDKSGCPSCPSVIKTAKRHRGFGLASDSPFPVSQTGRVDVVCADGATYNVPLRSTRRGGLFQIVPNLCPNLDSRELTLTVTSVGLSPPDAERSVTLITYGTFG